MLHSTNNFIKKNYSRLSHNTPSSLIVRIFVYFLTKMFIGVVNCLRVAILFVHIFFKKIMYLYIQSRVTYNMKFIISPQKKSANIKLALTNF